MDDEFDMFDTTMEEEEKGQEEEEEQGDESSSLDASTDNEEVEYHEDDGLTVKERSSRLLQKYQNNGLSEFSANFYAESNLTERGKTNIELREASGYLPWTSGERLIKRSGIARSSPQAKALTAQLVDTSVIALINRSLIPMALDRRVTIMTSDVVGANNMIGMQPV